MVEELLFLLCKLLLLFWREFSLILVVLNSDELRVADFNLLLKQELNLHFGKVDMRLTLSNDQVRVLLCIPLLLDTVSGSIVGNIDQLLIKSQLADLGGDQDALLSLLDKIQMELLLRCYDFLLDKVLLWKHFKLGLFVLHQLLDCLV